MAVSESGARRARLPVEVGQRDAPSKVRKAFAFGPSPPEWIAGEGAKGSSSSYTSRPRCLNLFDVHGSPNRTYNVSPTKGKAISSSNHAARA